MAWGIGWGLLIVAIVVLLFAYAVIQETRAQHYWRSLLAKGDVDAIRQVIEQEVQRWRTDRPPADVSPSVWHSVQTLELVEVGSDYVRVGCSVEGQYATENGRRREVSSALSEGMKATVKLADMFFYDIPNLRLDRIQIDVYTTFRDREGAAQECILSTLARRAVAAELDWEGSSAEEIVTRFGGRYRRDSLGATLPIEPDVEAVRAGGDGSRRPPTEC